MLKMSDTVYKAAIYCRLSKDDEQSGDSVSIETQKMMLTQFCEEQECEIFDIYVDDGYSGLNFNRPAFKRLIQDLEDKRFNTVITKDLSRLGRDYIQTGYYIDIYFTSKRIRYIALNDGIDTNRENNDIAPFKNILNDMYAKDISRKIKSAKLQRAKKGLHISAQTPYGYKVDPYNRNRLIIDEEAAPVVKLIFQLADDGKNFTEISKILESQKYITPSAHKTMQGDTRFIKSAGTGEEMYQWSYQTVRTILNNPVYVGDMVNHKVEVVNYKTKERVRVPLEEQIIVHNMHEAIIERDLFNRIKPKVTYRRSPNHQYENIFKGIIFCEECGTEMQLIHARIRKNQKLQFRCIMHFADKNRCTHHHSVFYNDLIFEIKKQLQSMIEDYINSDEYLKLCQSIVKCIYSKVLEKRRNALQDELTAIKKQIKNYYKNSVGSPMQGINSHELDFLLEKQKALVKRLGKMEFEHPTFTNQTFILNKIYAEAKEYIRKMMLNDNIIHTFIKKIEIGHLEKTSNGNRQNIIVYYNF